MNQQTRARLVELNRDFYEKHAAAFSTTRDHAWPGWARVLDHLDHPHNRGVAPAILDAGCGNGRFARFLHESGVRDIDYTGLDSSRALLDAARARLPSDTGDFRFVAGDLFDEGDLPRGPFDAIALFGVLHHVPGFDERARLIVRLASRLSEGGVLAATVWRFGSDARVVGRTLDWSAHPIPIDPDTLEPGDHLLRWGDDDDEVVRYCHFADDAEIERLLAATQLEGLEVIDRFRSDGRGGELNEYLIWTRARG